MGNLGLGSCSVWGELGWEMGWVWVGFGGGFGIFGIGWKSFWVALINRKMGVFKK